MISSRPTRRFALCGAALTIALVPFVQAQSSSAAAAPPVRLAAAATAEPELDATDAYRLALLKMKGHLGIARALVQLRAEGAAHHLGQPLEAIFRAAEAEFARRGAPFSADTLEELEHATGRDPVRTLSTIESAVTAINGSFAQTGAMDAGSVLALSEALLREAVAAYEGAVADNEVVDLRQYQRGRGFATEAEALVRHASQIDREPAHEDLLLAVTLIRQAWPGVMPPPIVFDPPSVAARLDQAVAAMDEMR